MVVRSRVTLAVVAAALATTACAPYTPYWQAAATVPLDCGRVEQVSKEIAKQEWIGVGETVGNVAALVTVIIDPTLSLWMTGAIAGMTTAEVMWGFAHPATVADLREERASLVARCSDRQQVIGP